MAKSANEIARLSNAFSTGSGGANFERHVQAVFALTLLIDGFSPIMNIPIQRLDFQAKYLGYDIDDLVVTATKAGKEAKLLCQIKHDLIVSDKNKTFQEVITAAWNDFNKVEFRDTIDRIALITGIIAKDSVHALHQIHSHAVNSLSADEFHHRMELANSTAESSRTKYKAIKACIEATNEGLQVSDYEMWRFCRCLVLLVFDLSFKESVNRTLIRSLIQCNTEQDAELVWSRLSEQCGEWNQEAAAITKSQIPNDILRLFGRAHRNEVEMVTYVPAKDNRIWSAAVLVGYWDEKREADIRAVEQLTGMDYHIFQTECRQYLQEQRLILRNGCWKINNRISELKANKDHYYDDMIKTAFQITSDYLKENSRQFSENGRYIPVVPVEGKYSNSEGFRKGLLEGLCILANGDQPAYCTEMLFQTESRTLIRDTLMRCDWIRMVSVSDVIAIMAELNPGAFLNCLESYIFQNPHEIIKLFPKASNDVLFDQNFITNYLFALERLAWFDEYMVACVRCLGVLETVKYESTNWANTPVNTITKVLRLFWPQTLAKVEKRQRALQALYVDSPDICWEVLHKLLSRQEMSVLCGSERPEYISITIPDENELPKEKCNDLQEYYIQYAIKLAGNQSERLTLLLDCVDFMNTDYLVLLIQRIIDSSIQWTAVEKCDMWISLSDIKYKTLMETDGVEPDSPQYEELCRAINVLNPDDIMFRYKRIFLSAYNEYLLDEEHWEKVDRVKQQAVRDIYVSLGIDAAIQFGISVDALAYVGNWIGEEITENEVILVIPKLQETRYAIFYNNLIGAYLFKHGVSAIERLNLHVFEPPVRALVLKQAPFTDELIGVIPQYLKGNEELFWKSVRISPYGARHGSYDMSKVVHILLEYHRAPTAIMLLGRNITKLEVADALITELLFQGPQDTCDGNLDPYSVRELIKHLQGSKSPDIMLLSEIEFVYLPWLGDNSNVKPKAITYTLANNPESFCKLMETVYKKRHADEPRRKHNKAMADRLFALLHPYKVIPGIDWGGLFHEGAFLSWMDKVMEWAKENDRYEVSMHTIGNALAYAQFSEAQVIDEVIMRMLNRLDCEELRRGYHIGVFNKRGVHWIDPEGKPEKELARKYNLRAEAADDLGYARFAELLRAIADGYLAEAKENARESIEN